MQDAIVCIAFIVSLRSNNGRIMKHGQIITSKCLHDDTTANWAQDGALDSQRNIHDPSKYGVS